MRRLVVPLAVVVIVVAIIVLFLPELTVWYYSSVNPLQQKAQALQNYQTLCQQWNSTDCAGSPSDALCRAAVGHIASQFVPLNTQNCVDISSEGIQLLRTACCG